jgi:ferredoxin-like protein FixX
VSAIYLLGSIVSIFVISAALSWIIVQVLFIRKESTMGEAHRRMQQQQQMINVNMDELKTIQCQCGKFVFEQVLVLKVIPAVLSNTGKEGLVQLPCLKCVECGAVHTMDSILKNIQPSNKVIDLSGGN